MLRAALAAIAARPALALSEPATPAQRLIAFVDIVLPYARQGYERMQRTIAERGLPARFGAQLRFVPTNQTDPKSLAALPDTIRALRPAAIVATSVPTARAVRELGIPAVFFSRGDPVALGLVNSFRRPGGNLTGYAAIPPSVDKMLEILADAFPRLREIGVVIDRYFPGLLAGDAALHAAARSRGMRLHVLQADSLEDLRALTSRSMARLNGLVVTYGVVPFLHSAPVVELINSLGIPAIYGSSRNVRDGGLIGFEADIAEAADSFGRQLEAILGGTRAGDIPVERPRIYRLSVNLGAARKAGLRVSPAFLKRADIVLQ